MASAGMPVYLFVGDSLTEGTYGENYVERLARALYRGQAGLEGDVVNAGRGGETVASLLGRMDSLLQRYQPGWVVLAIGVNDVWLSWLAGRSVGWWLWLGYRRLAEGQKTTTDLDQFAASYRALIDKARQASARVLICTTVPVGEKLSSPVNRRLARLNGVIKHVAADLEVPVADIWQAYVDDLATLSRPSGYAPAEWLFAWLDRGKLARSSADQLARRRHLSLTFDGLHLSSRGADLWAKTILAAMARANWTAADPGFGAIQKLDLSVFGLGPIQVYSTPGWEERARDVARLLSESYTLLASLTNARLPVWLAILNHVHWLQVASSHPYPAPTARWEGSSGTVFVPDSYPTPYLRDMLLPDAVSVWHKWPPALAQVGEPARLTALADLLAVHELAQIFLQDLQVVPTDPSLGQLVAAYLTEVVLHGRQSEGATEMAGAWQAWSQVLAASGSDLGKVRQQAADLYASHGDGLVGSFVGRPAELERQVSNALSRTGPGR